MAVDKRDNLYLAHILDAVIDVENFLSLVSYSDFSKSDLLQSAVIRKIEIMGEAAKRLSAGCRKFNADIPWKKITGMRDVLIHDYFGIDIKAVWNTAQIDLPKLKKNLVIITKKKIML